MSEYKLRPNTMVNNTIFEENLSVLVFDLILTQSKHFIPIRKYFGLILGCECLLTMIFRQPFILSPEWY